MTTTLEPATATDDAVKGGVIAYLMVNSATAAADFYVKALGARIVGGYPPDENGRTMHIHLHVNGSSIMLGDPCPEQGFPHQPPQAFNLVLPVGDADRWWKRAVDAGAEPVMPVQDMFWGDRYGQFRDPFGVLWAVNQPQG